MYLCLYDPVLDLPTNSSHSICNSDPEQEHARLKREMKYPWICNKVMEREGNRLKYPWIYDKVMERERNRLLKQERKLLRENKKAMKEAKRQAKTKASARNKLIEELAMKSNIQMENAEAFVKSYINGNNH